MAALPSSDELIYAHHERGLALLRMRGPDATRLYTQCDPDEDINNWPDGRVWEQLHVRLGSGGAWKLIEGPVLQKSVTGMRSFVAEPMRYGKLFLAGDAAHMVPPTAGVAHLTQVSPSDLSVPDTKTSTASALRKGYSVCTPRKHSS